MKTKKLLCAILAFLLLPCQLICAEELDSSPWGDIINMDVSVQVSEDAALRYLGYYEESFTHAGYYASLTLEERTQYPNQTVVEPMFDTLPQEDDIPWEDALVSAYAWIEQNGHLQGEDFRRYVVSTHLFGIENDPRHLWHFSFDLWDVAENWEETELKEKASFSIYIDTQTGHITSAWGYWNSKG